ncbi:MAG: hypothetical protein RIR26_2852 [Pseudomonadota bacterium]|jgi:hypothetical protein
MKSRSEGRKFFQGSLLVLSLLSGSFAFADTIKNFSATYAVPVEDGALKPFSIFKIEPYTVIIPSSGPATLTFELPEDLTAGEKKTVSFVETENNGHERVLKGEAGTIRCSVPWLESVCQVEFSKAIVPDWMDIVDHMIARYGDTEEWLDRALVVDRFSTEPIGTVRVTGVLQPSE